MIDFSQEPQLTSANVSRGFPTVLSFQASSDNPATYLVSWGDGTTARGLLPSSPVRLTHSYDNKGVYFATLQIFSGDTSELRRLTVTVTPSRARETPLYRWSGPVLGLKSTSSSYNQSFDLNPAPTEYKLAAPTTVGTKTITLQSGISLKPGDKIVISEGKKLTSGGTVMGSSQASSGTIVELDFFVTDSYSIEGYAQVVPGPSYGVAVVPKERIMQFGGARDDDLIFDSVGLILSTRPGERVMRPTFGFRGHELVFDPNDSSLAALGQAYVVEALNSEPRAGASGISFKSTGNSLSVSGNLVFPSGNLATFNHDLLNAG